MSVLSKVPNKVLIVLLGAIGDVTRALPLAMRIKQSWPGCELHWAVEPISRPLLENHPAIDKILVFDRPRGLSAFFEFARQLSREEYDLVLDLQRHFKSGVTSWSTRAKRRLGFNWRSAKEFNWVFNNEHIGYVPNFSSKLEHYQKFGDQLGLKPLEPFTFGLEATAAQLEKVRGLIDLDSQAVVRSGINSKSVVSMLIGSTWESRFWIASYYSELVNQLQEKFGLISLLVGGKREREFVEMVKKRANSNAFVDLVEKTKLSDLPAVFSLSRFAIGSDSGPMHIAAASGLRVISLWGSTSPRRSAPYGSEDLVLQSNVRCSPCYRKRCPGYGQICMTGITVEMVLAKVEEVLKTAS